MLDAGCRLAGWAVYGPWLAGWLLLACTPHPHRTAPHHWLWLPASLPAWSSVDLHKVTPTSSNHPIKNQ